MNRFYGYEHWGRVGLGLFVGLLFVVCARNARAEAALATGFDPPSPQRGALVTVTGRDLPDQAIVKVDDTQVVFVATSNDHASLTFWLRPSDGRMPSLALGTHIVHIIDTGSPGAKEIPSIGTLKIISGNQEPPQIDSISPDVLYAGDAAKTVSLTGDHFSAEGPDNVLLVDGIEQTVCWEPCSSATKGIHGSLKSNREIALTGFFPGAGVHKIRIRREEQASQPVVLTRTSRTASETRWIAAAATLVIFLGALVFADLAAGPKRHVVAGKEYRFFQLLFIDTDSDTYSLGRLQFFVWSAVGLFAYAYLWCVTTMVQQQFLIPDVSPSLMIIWGISVGTGVTALGIKNSKGPEGSGAVYPSLADFLTTGGVVAPEKFQYLLWTVIATLTFLFAVLNQDAAHLSALPDIPQNILYLMGISSAGYIGGKVARKAGPVIDSILPIGDDTLEVRGRGLSKDATFSIGDRDLGPLLAAGSPSAEELDGNDATMAKCIRLRFREGRAWEHIPGAATNAILRVTNPDGQRADWPVDARQDRLTTSFDTRTGTGAPPPALLDGTAQGPGMNGVPNQSVTNVAAAFVATPALKR